MTVTTITTSDGCAIEVERTGTPKGVTVIFSNSLGADRTMWDAQADALEGGYDVVRYDTRGHGGSQAPVGAYSMDRLSLDVLEIMDALKISSAHFCGLSLGGMTGQTLAVRARNQFSSMILSTTSAYMGPPENWQARIDTVLTDGMVAVSAAIVSRWLSSAFLTENPTLVECLKGIIDGMSAVGYAGCCAAIRDMDLRPFTGINEVPTLVIVGRDDQATPLPHGRYICETAQNAELIEVDGAHVPNLEHPDVFNRLMLDFLRRSGASQ